MTHGDLKWFLALSAAAHLAVLGVWSPPLSDIGQRGPVLDLEMVNRAGATVRPTPPAEPPNTEPAVNSAPDAMRDTPPARRASAPARPTTARERTPDPPVAARRTPPMPDPQPAAVAATGPESEPRDTDRHLRDTLLELVTANLRYPPIARRRGWQGTVVLQLRIEADGQVSDLRVNASSGYPVLDRAALACLRLASIPQADRWLHGRAVDILVPVEYRLVDG